MNAINPLNSSRELKLKLPADAKGEISVFLAAGDAGDGATGDVVRWGRPRLMLSGSAPIPLGAINGLMSRMEALQSGELARTEQYLRVIAEADLGGKSIDEVAKGRGLDPRVLGNWSTAVQLGKFTVLKPEGRYPKKMFKVGGYDDIRGWGEPSTPSVIANKSAETIRFASSRSPL